MRIFQNSSVYPSYRLRLRALTAGAKSFDEAIAAFLDDRFGAPHFLRPVLDGSRDAFFTNGDDEVVQRMWADENGLSSGTSLEDILLAQIEDHRTEVFYNLDPMRYGDAFLARLPGSVRKTIAWRAAPSDRGAFLKYDLIVNNFPSLLEGYRASGARAEFLAPAHDPAMDAYATTADRPIDVLFVGTYSRHHRNRAAMLQTIASLRKDMTVAMCLDVSRYTRLAETPLGWVGPLRKDRRNRDLRAVSRPPVFGRDLLAVLGGAKIVVNGAIDMAGHDRGNMRVWESLGCRAALVSDQGIYPPGMDEGIHFQTYGTTENLRKLLLEMVADQTATSQLATRGNTMIRSLYSKDRQWERFAELAS